jgi:hypothetical protein
MHGALTVKQQERLLEPPRLTEELRGNIYIPQHEVRAELTRIFGHGRWDSQVIAMELIFEEHSEDDVTEKGQTVKKWRWHVGYRCGVSLRIRDSVGTPVAEFLEWHCDETIHPSRGEAHAGAITSAESYAFRRAAIGLGDRFGLGLYGKNNGAPLVKGTLPLFEMQKADTGGIEAAEQRLAEELGATPVEDPKDSSSVEDGTTQTVNA